MNRKAEHLEARIARLEQDIRTAHDQLAAARYELQQLDRQPEVTYTSTDKKRIFVNGEVVYEQGGKSVKPRAKVVAVKERDMARNDDGSYKINEHGRGYMVETGEIAYGVKFSGMDALKLRNDDDGMYAGCERLWEAVVELS